MVFIDPESSKHAGTQGHVSLCGHHYWTVNHKLLVVGGATYQLACLHDMPSCMYCLYVKTHRCHTLLCHIFLCDSNLVYLSRQGSTMHLLHVTGYGLMCMACRSGGTLLGQWEATCTCMTWQTAPHMSWRMHEGTLQSPQCTMTRKGMCGWGTRGVWFGSGATAGWRLCACRSNVSTRMSSEYCPGSFHLICNLQHTKLGNTIACTKIRLCCAVLVPSCHLVCCKSSH